MLNVLLNVLVVCCCCSGTTVLLPEQYRVGGLFSDINQEVAFKVAVNMLNNQELPPTFELSADSYNVSFYNTFEARKGVCSFLKKGVIGIFGPSSTFSSPYIQAVCDYKEIPQIETHWDSKLERNSCLVNLYPHPSTLSDLYTDMVLAYDWHGLVVLYETEEHLSKVSTLLELNTYHGKNVVLKRLEQDVLGTYIPMFTAIRKSKEKHFLIECSTNTLKKVLENLQQVGMMTELYSYIITNFDLQTIELSAYQFGGTNITGVRIVNPESMEVISVATKIQKIVQSQNSNSTEIPDFLASWKLKLETALLFDGVKLFYETLHDLLTIENKKVKAASLTCNSTDNWNYGYTIVNYMKGKTIEGLSGTIKFDYEGFRKEIKLDILELSVGGLTKIGEWNSTKGIVNIKRKPKPIEDEDLEPESNLFKRTFTVITCLTPPYGMLKETTSQLIGNNRFEGFSIDLIQELSQMLGFNYTLEIQEDGDNGNFNKTTGEWSGMIRKIIDEKADLAITDLTITSERESAVDFTMPFMNLGITILYKKPEPAPPSLFMFTSPFSTLVWIMLGVSYLVVSIAIFIMGRLSPSEWTNPYPCVEEPEFLINQFSIRNSLWFTVATLMQQGSEIAPISISTRTASSVWWFFVLIMVSSYTANLAAFLTVETLVNSFKNIGELAKQQEIQFGAKKGGATETFFKNSNDSTYKKIAQYMQKHPENMLDNNDEGVERVKKGNYAYLMESTSIEYVTERHCTLSQVGGLLSNSGYGIAMKKFSPYRNDLSTTILKLQESGRITQLKWKWWKEKRGGGSCGAKSEGGEATALDLQNVGGVFLVLFIGTVLGVLGSFLELVHNIYRKCKATKLQFKEELKTEMKFIIDYKKNVKEIRETPNEFIDDDPQTKL